MLKFKPESLEAIRVRLPKALSRRFDVDAIYSAKAQRPGEIRDHVLDMDNIRCIVSVDYQGTRHEAYLHLSCSSTLDTELTLEQFLERAEGMATLFWPDTVLVLFNKLATPKAIHFFYKLPTEFLKLSEH